MVTIHRWLELNKLLPVDRITYSVVCRVDKSSGKARCVKLTQTRPQRYLKPYASRKPPNHSEKSASEGCLALRLCSPSKPNSCSL